jgi:hypothetical protein
LLKWIVENVGMKRIAGLAWAALALGTKAHLEDREAIREDGSLSNLGWLLLWSP